MLTGTGSQSSATQSSATAQRRTPGTPRPSTATECTLSAFPHTAAIVGHGRACRTEAVCAGHVSAKGGSRNALRAVSAGFRTVRSSTPSRSTVPCDNHISHVHQERCTTPLLLQVEAETDGRSSRQTQHHADDPAGEHLDAAVSNEGDAPHRDGLLRVAFAVW